MARGQTLGNVTGKAYQCIFQGMGEGATGVRSGQEGGESSY